MRGDDDTEGTSEEGTDGGTDVSAEMLEIARMCFDWSREGDTAKLRLYVRHGVPADLTDADGNTLLMLAAYHGHPETVRMLLELGADANRLNDRGQSPVAGAVFKGEDEVVRVLVTSGADLDLGSPTARETAQMFGREDLIGDG
jgi:ankyrin repeat protein